MSSLAQDEQDLAVRLQARLPLPPMRGMSVLPDFASAMADLILNRRPQTILELGSGISTVVAAYCVERNRQGHILSLDHDRRFAARTQSLLLAHDLGQFVTIRHAPLQPVSLKGTTFQWYDQTALAELPPVDLLLVDGPPGYQGGRTRYPALPLLFAQLAPGAVIMLDDAARADERSIIGEWMVDFPGFDKTDLPHAKGTAILTRR